jgi:Uma2 family endonuclease
MSAIAIPIVRPSVSPAPIEPEDLLLMEDKGLFELVDGRLVEKSLGLFENAVAGIIFKLLGIHLDVAKLGGLVVPETSFQCFPRKPKQIRRPDVAFISAAKLPKDLPTGHVTIVPDIAVEVVSPNDVPIELEERLLDYQSAGIPLVWVVYPTAWVIRVHTANGPSTALLDGAVLSGEPVLTGFEVKVTDLFTAVLPVEAKPE